MSFTAFLKHGAALEGVSLSEYLLAEIRRSAERPTLRELRSGSTADARVPDVPPAEVIRELRGPAVIVVDASAALEVLLQTPAARALKPACSLQGKPCMRRTSRSGGGACAPPLCGSRVIDAQRGQEAIDEL